MPRAGIAAMAMAPEGPAVAVLMATFNGAAHLAAQLDSFAGQSLPPRWLVVSDDGSTDATLEILADFASRHPAISVTVLHGPRRGAAEGREGPLGRPSINRPVRALIEALCSV